MNNLKQETTQKVTDQINQQLFDLFKSNVLDRDGCTVNTFILEQCVKVSEDYILNEINELNERLNSSSLLYKDSIKEIETHINEKVHWFNSYTNLQSKLKEKDSIIDDLTNKLEAEKEATGQTLDLVQEQIDNLQSQLQASNAMAERLYEALQKVDSHIKEFYPNDDPTCQLGIFVIDKALEEYQNSKK